MIVKKFQKILMLLLMTGITTSNVIAKDKKEVKDDLKMFPTEVEGKKRVVINLPKQKNDADYKVEFFVGKMTTVDACNRFFLSGNLKEEVLSGWGYNYFTFDTKAGIAGTLMACPDNKTVTKFISAPSKIINYNSKLPIVVYIPDGYEVRYKFWKAQKKELKAIQK